MLIFGINDSEVGSLKDIYARWKSHPTCRFTLTGHEHRAFERRKAWRAKTAWVVTRGPGSLDAIPSGRDYAAGRRGRSQRTGQTPLITDGTGGSSPV